MEPSSNIGKIGAFFGIGLIAFLQSQQISEIENVFLIGSFGASSVLVYGAIQSPLAQPRNLIGKNPTKLSPEPGTR